MEKSQTTQTKNCLLNCREMARDGSKIFIGHVSNQKQHALVGTPILSQVGDV